MRQAPLHYAVPREGLSGDLTKRRNPPDKMEVVYIFLLLLKNNLEKRCRKW